MSGHSKWSSIKHKKAAVDAKRGKLFTRLIRELTVAARLGGGDAAANPRLRSATQDAKASNVPAGTIEEDFIELAVEVGADDFAVDGAHFEIFTTMEAYAQVREDLEGRDLALEVKELSMVPQNYVAVEETGLAKVLRLLEAMDQLDDVQSVWANFDADGEVLARVSESV